MAILYVKNKYTPIVLITLVITLAYIFLVLYYIQMIDNNIGQYSLPEQKGECSIKQAGHKGEDKKSISIQED